MFDLINDLDTQWKITVWLIIVTASVLLALVGIKLNNRFFRRIERKHPDIHLPILEKMISIFIVLFYAIFLLSTFSGAQTMWQTVFGGTAIVSAVLVFAAQDTIKDLLAGLMIGIYKPFVVGDRIVLEDGTAGVVEKITLRHVVMTGIDTLRIVVPNSRVNAMQLKNFSYKSELNAAQFRFSVGYDSNMEQVKKVIGDAIEQSEYTVPGKKDKEGNTHYGPVYFISFADSALIMAVTVYYEKNCSTEIVTNDINTRVREALIANGIEIPYNYINVINTTEKSK